MAARVAVYRLSHHGRSAKVCEAIAIGIRACGDTATIIDDGTYTTPLHDVAVFYGLAGRLPKVLDDYARLGRKAVYIDLGYWSRRSDPDRYAGYHKFCINDRHPVHFDAVPHPPDRLKRFGIEIKPWRAGSKVLVAGMSAKAARSLGMEPGSWERLAVKALREHTDREIVYRPKPSCRESEALADAGISRGESLQDAFSDCHCVVTHHSNVAVDAILSGVPALCWHGVATKMSGQDFSMIERPPRPDGRAQFAADVAYTQFNLYEMRNGIAWRHLKAEGLVP